ncbi:MAG: peptide deformylase [Phycisphaerae bacterium]
MTASELVIINYPDPRLRKRCAQLEQINDEVRVVAARMVELMQDVHGVGLAAPQVGLLWRLFVCQPGEGAAVRIFVNPTLTPGPELESGEEGCLSIPDVTVTVQRSKTCEIHATDLDGRAIHLRAEGLPSRAWQHENDHLDGRLIVDVMNEAEKIANRKALKQLEKEYKMLHRKARPARR